MKKNNSKEDLQSFLTFDSHPKLIAYLFTFFWAFFVMALLGQLIKCLGSILLIFLFSFTLYVLPSWLGLFYSKKKRTLYFKHFNTWIFLDVRVCCL